MCKQSIETTIDKIKVTDATIIVGKIKGQLYYSIMYKPLFSNEYNTGFSSYDADIVFNFLDKYFEVVDAQDHIDTNEKSSGYVLKDLMQKISTYFMGQPKRSKQEIKEIMKRYNCDEDYTENISDDFCKGWCASRDITSQILFDLYQNISNHTGWC